MSRPTRVAAAQINVTVGDFAGNARRIADGMRRAKAARASLVAFPELAVTGYPPEDALFQPRFVDENLRALRALARRAPYGLAAVVGFVDRDEAGRLYNAAAVLVGGRTRTVYRKCALPNYGVFDEKRYFHEGAGPVIVGLPGGAKAGLTICEDIWLPGSPLYRRSAWTGADLVVNLSASPFHAGKQAQRHRVVGDFARAAGAPVLYANLVGGQDELVFDGGSLLTDAQGRVRAEAARFREDLLVAEVPPRRGRRPAALSTEEEVYDALVLGTRDYVEKNGFPGVLVGLSGGIDSALVAAIAVDALGARRVRGVTMPSEITSRATLADARRLAASLGVRLDEFAIAPLLRAYLETLAPAFRGRAADVTEENLQARIRGNLLMALSNKFGSVVLTTGNKSEMATGYCTLYGDMAGGFAVIKDVPKTLVFRLARWRNRRARREIIPASIVRRAPTAELRAGQRDSDSLPAYPRLDRFLEAFVENDRPVDAIVRGGFPRGLAASLARKVYANEYKRRQAPPGVKITPKAFGRDRRMPITNRFRP